MNRLQLTRQQLTIVALAAMLPAVSAEADEAKPAREAFISEVLDAKPTSSTPQFDSDAPGGYRIQKLDLFEGLIAEAKRRKLTLRAVNFFGPLSAESSTVRVIVFLQDGEKVRVNSLTKSSNRITGKATCLITADQYKKWRDGVIESGALNKELPAGDAEGEPTAFAAQLVLVVWSDDGKSRHTYGGRIIQTGKADQSEKLNSHYREVFKELKETYPVQDK